MAEWYTSNIYKKTSNALTQVAGHKVGVKRLRITNVDGATRYLQFFDALSANVTLGTTAPTMVYAVAATSTLELAPDFATTTAFTFAVTTTSTGSIGPTEVWVEVLI